MDYSFNLYNSLAPSGITIALKKMFPEITCPPVILCIGSDLSVGDSLGPLSGTKIKQRLMGLNCFVYGTLSKPITAHEVKYMNGFLKNTHPQSPVIAIDAAVGVSGDVGLIKISKKGVVPGSGANKKLGKIGDASIMAVVAEKSILNYSLFSSTRLNIVNKMSDIICDGICDYYFDILQSNFNIAQ